MPRLRSGLALLVFAALAAGSAGCGKSAVDVSVRWESSAESGLAAARAQNKPLFVFFGAEWDMAAKEIEHVTLVDPEVAMLLHRHFVSVHVDMTDDENRDTHKLAERFKVIGEPALILLAPDGVSEIARYNEYVDPRVFARWLRAAPRKTTLVGS